MNPLEDVEVALSVFREAVQTVQAWACVGCQPPHWEDGVYIEQWTVHPDCRRHQPQEKP